jgi:hypothetical protein
MRDLKELMTLIRENRYFYLFAFFAALILGFLLASLFLVTVEVLSIAERGYFVAPPKAILRKGFKPPSNFVVPEGFRAPKNIGDSDG